MLPTDRNVVFAACHLNDDYRIHLAVVTQIRNELSRAIYLRTEASARQRLEPVPSMSQ
jgi:hypothetical protein